VVQAIASRDIAIDEVRLQCGKLVIPGSGHSVSSWVDLGSGVSAALRADSR
jgi:hypothetical protein